MAVTLVGSTAFNDGSSSSTNPISANIPAATQAGDLGIFIALGNTPNTSTFTAPSGWTSLVGPNNTSSNLQTQVWVKDLVAADAGASATWSNSTAPSRFIGLMAVYRGTQGAASVTAGTPTLSTTSTTSLVEPSITTTVPLSWVVGLWTMRIATAAPSATLSYPGTETFDARCRTAWTASPNYTIEASHLTTPGAAGSYGGTTATASATSTNQNLYVLAIPPLPSTHFRVRNRARFRAVTF